MQDIVKVAGVQFNPKLMANDENREKMLAHARIAAGHGANLVVFPECALCGYMFNSREEAIPYMETIPGPFTEALANCCGEHNIYIVVGLLEKDGDRCYNSAVLVGTEGLIGKYRKIHLPFIGVDRFTDRGEQTFEVYQTPIGNIGLHICYDCTFPESARVMTIKKADILVLPTNWPESREIIPAHVVITRAYENRLHVVAIDRVGEERGATFLGHSKIVDSLGKTLAEASGDREEIIYAELSLEAARQKKIIIKAGESEIDPIGDRNPELYSTITEVQDKEIS